MVILNLGLVGSSTVLAVGSPRQSDQKKNKNVILHESSKIAFCKF